MAFSHKLKTSLLIILYINFPTTSFSQTNNYARHIIQQLASPDFFGRGYCYKGDLLAAAFIADEFKKAGVKPLQHNYYQYFTINVNTFCHQMLFIIDNDTLKPGIDFLVHPSSDGIKGKFEINHANETDFASKHKYDSILQNCVNSCIYIHLTGNQIIKSVSDSISFYIKKLELGENQLKIIIKEKKDLVWGIDQKNIKKTIIEIAGNEKIKTCKDCIVDIGNELVTNYQTQNVTAIIPGTLKPDSFLIVTAHYDHLGCMGKTSYFPGANDNASGVAMLLSLADYYAKNPPEFTIIFLAFSAEELGLVGSTYFVNHSPVDLKKIKFLINIDLAGTGDEGIKVVNGSVYCKEFSRLKFINDTLHLVPGVFARGKACNSDHCPFDQAGIPCFFIYTLGGNAAYHSVSDRPETLPLTVFDHYFELMIKFLNSF